MKTKDQILLEKIYTTNLLSESIYDINSLKQSKEVNDDIFDVSDDNFELDKLEKCTGSITSYAKNVSLKSLEETNGIYAYNAKNINLSNLKICNSKIDLENILNLDLSNLEKCVGRLYAKSAKNANLSSLIENKQGLYIPEAENVYLGSLKESGSIFLPKVKKIDISKLEKCVDFNSGESSSSGRLGDILIYDVKGDIDLSSLRICKDIHIRDCNFLNLKSLKVFNTIKISGILNKVDLSGLESLNNFDITVNEINLINLKESKGYFYIYTAQNLNLINLKKSEKIFFPDATTANLKNLEEAEEISLIKAKTVDLSNLKKCSKLEIWRAEKLYISKDFFDDLVKNNQIQYDKSKCEIIDSFELKQKELKQQEVDKTGFEPKQMLDPEKAKQLEGLF